MLPANLISALQALSNVGKLPPTSNKLNTPNQSTTLTTGDTLNKPLAKLEVGQQIQGTVQSRMGEGLFKVQVAGQSLQMRLPGILQSGDVINLQVASTKPRLTFSIAASNNPLSTPEQIGSTARLLSNLADLPLERPIVKQLAGSSIWQATQQAPDTQQLAGALREALANSGLFYESHQAQWIQGRRSTAQLLIEPQNRSLEMQQVVLNSPSRTLQISAENGLAIPKELLHLMQQQLHTLEHHQLTWVGQVWPGQEMQWEIQGQPERQATPDADARQWSTEMELALPKLGDVHVRLVLSQGALQLVLHAADTATVELFKCNLSALGAALDEQQVPLSSASVEKS